MFERVGHLPQVERPEKYASLVEDFWAQAESDASVPSGSESAAGGVGFPR